MWTRVLLGTALALAACGGGDDDPGEPAAAASGEAAGDLAGAAAGKPLPVDPAAGPELRIETIDDRRWLVDDAVLAQLAIDAAAGELRAGIGKDGIRIDQVAEGSTLARLGLQAGDRIAGIGGEPITAAAQLRAAWSVARKEGSIRAELVRDGKSSERRYYLIDALDRDLQDALQPPGPASKGNSALPRLEAALRTGVRQVGPDSYEVDEKVLAVAAAERPPVGAGASYSRRARVIDPAGLPAALGITRYDTVKAVDDQDLFGSVGLARELARLSGQKAREFTITLVRVKEPLVLRYRVVTDLVMDAELDAAMAAWKAEEDQLHPPLPDYPTFPAVGGDAGVPLTSDDVAALLDAGIKKIDDENYEIDRGVIDKLLANPLALSKGARIVPSIKDGRPNGMKLYAIRPSSFYARIGLANGDTVHAINGYDLSSLDRGLEVYTKVRSARSVDLDITRRGKPVRLRYRIR